MGVTVCPKQRFTLEFTPMKSCQLNPNIDTSKFALSKNRNIIFSPEISLHLSVKLDRRMWLHERMKLV